MPRILLLLLPSVSSGALVIIGTTSILLASGWSYIQNNQLFYDELFGVYGFKTLLLQNDSLYTLQHALLESTFTYYALLFVTGIVVGFMVFTLLEAIRLGAKTAAEELHQLEDSNPTHKVAAHEAFERLLLRVASLIGWGAFAIIFINIILPFSILLNQAGIDAFDSSRVNGIWYCTQAFLLLAISLHMHVVFARLCVLRPRLFGDSDIEMAKYRKY